MDTAPLPRIPPEPAPWGDQAGLPASARAPAPAGRRASGGLRAVEVAAGLASGGLVIIGLGLVLLQLFAAYGPSNAADLSYSAGPTWWRALAQLGVGLAGEGLVLARPRLAHGSRVWLAVAVLAMTAAVLWCCWWA